MAATNAPLYLHIAWLNGLRDKYIALRRGSFTELAYSGGQGQFVFKKQHGNQIAVVHLNPPNNGITSDSIMSVANTRSTTLNTNNVKAVNGSFTCSRSVARGPGLREQPARSC